MGKKYIIELEDKPFHKEDGDFLYRVKGFNSLVFDMTGIGMLTPYTEPDLEQVKKKAYDEGYQSGREDLNIVMSDVEQAKADAYLKGLNDGQGVILASTQNNAFNNGYKKCLKDIEQVRKEAYQKGYETGYEDGYNEPGKNQQEAYQRGLADAWEACKKIGCYEIDGGYPATQMLDLFDRDDLPKILSDYTASEAIEKIRQYEQEQEEQIQVGDEVRNIKNGWIAVVCNIGGECLTLMDTNGALGDGYDVNRFTKTGRHFPEIAAVLEKMRGESND